MNRSASPAGPTLSRRALLGAACGASSLFGGLAGCGRTYPPRPSSRAGTTVVDVHCHLFNASDLPVRGFAQRVVLGDPEDQVVLGPDPRTSRAALPHLAGLLVELLSGPAPTAQAELAAIDQDGGRVLRARPPGPYSRTDVERVRQALQNVLASWQRMLDEGQFASVRELAEAERVSLSYTSRILRLTLLAPDIVERILDCRPAPRLAELMQPLPGDWEQQRTEFC